MHRDPAYRANENFPGLTRPRILFEFYFASQIKQENTGGKVSVCCRDGNTIISSSREKSSEREGN